MYVVLYNFVFFIFILKKQKTLFQTIIIFFLFPQVKCFPKLLSNGILSYSRYWGNSKKKRKYSLTTDVLYSHLGNRWKAKRRKEKTEPVNKEKQMRSTTNIDSLQGYWNDAKKDLNFNKIQGTHLTVNQLLIASQQFVCGCLIKRQCFWKQVEIKNAKYWLY